MSVEEIAATLSNAGIWPSHYGSLHGSILSIWVKMKHCMLSVFLGRASILMTALWVSSERGLHTFPINSDHLFLPQYFLGDLAITFL